MGGKHLIDLLIAPIYPKEGKLGTETLVHEGMLRPDFIIPACFRLEGTVFFLLERGIEASRLVAFGDTGIYQARGREDVFQGELRSQLTEDEVALELLHQLLITIGNLVVDVIVRSLFVIVSQTEGERKAFHEQVI